MKLRFTWDDVSDTWLDAEGSTWIDPEGKGVLPPRIRPGDPRQVKQFSNRFAWDFVLFAKDNTEKGFIKAAAKRKLGKEAAIEKICKLWVDEGLLECTSQDPVRFRLSQIWFEIEAESTPEGQQLADYLEAVRQKVQHIEVFGRPGKSWTIDLEDRYVEQLSRKADDRKEQKEDQTTPILTALESLEYALITGPAGMGKTTLLKELARRAATDRQGRVPFFANCSELISENADLLLAIKKHQSVVMHQRIIDTAIQDGTADIFLDSIDQIVKTPTTSTESEDSFRKALEKLLRDLPPGNRIRATSREEAVTKARFDENWLSDHHLQLQPIRNQEDLQTLMRKYAEGICQEYKPESTPDDILARIDKHLRSTPSMREMLGTPLLTTILVVYFSHYDDPPRNRAELYERLLEHLFQGYESARAATTTWLEFSVALGEFCLDAFQGAGSAQWFGERGSFRDETLLEWLRKNLDRHDVMDRTAFLEKLKSRCPVLEFSDGTFTFRHLSFAEYLAARALVASTSLDGVEVIRAHRLDPGWVNLIALAIGRIVCKDTVKTPKPEALSEAARVIEDGLFAEGDYEVPDVAFIAWREGRGNPNFDLVRQLYNILFGAVVAAEHGLSFDRFDPLSELTSLEELRLSNTQVSDLNPLTELTSLRWLYLRNTQVSVLNPLSELRSLEGLDLTNTQVSVLNPLSELTSLKKLRLNNTQVSDLNPLSELTSLEVLDLDNTHVSDLNPLSELTSLEDLSLNNTQVSVLNPLSKLTSLRWLSLSNTQVSVLNPLTELTSLRWLYLSNTQVSEGEVEWLREVHRKRTSPQECTIVRSPSATPT